MNQYMHGREKTHARVFFNWFFMVRFGLNDTSYSKSVWTDK